MIKNFQIGDFCFSIDYPDEIVPPKNFLLFETGKNNPTYHYQLEICDTFPEIQGQIITQRADLVVFNHNGLEARLLGVKGIEGYYAYYQEETEHSAHIYLHATRIQGLHIDPMFTSLLALEKQMLKRNQLILHCAYLRHGDEAILFSAPSETGKSTQANLWEKYMGSQTINGDRALLTKKKQQWFALGWPVCGSSEICHNIETPIKAIVMLSQAPSNFIETLSPAKAFTQLYSQITINKWQVQDHMKAMAIIDQIIADIPIYHLGCTISKEAVDVLADALQIKQKDTLE